MKETAGLGTSATRASIIKNIVDKGYAKRNKRVLLATDKSFTLMAILPAAIKSPGMTAAWEQELSKIGNNNKQKLFSCNQLSVDISITWLAKRRATWPPVIYLKFSQT